jgi:ADP-ribose pyrophosphatase YjhB (NUDIX family)
MLLPLLRRSWGPDTCDPSDLADWQPRNPSRGQSPATALLVAELMGGELVQGRISTPGRMPRPHWWNRLPDGNDLDLTRDQLRPGEIVTGGARLAYSPGPPMRGRGQHALLRHRVLTALHRLPPPDPAAPPLRLAMALLVDPGGAVLVRRRPTTAAFEPSQWTLPTAVLHEGELPEPGARRALAEEASVEYADRLHAHWHGRLPDVTLRHRQVEVWVLAGRHDLDETGILADDLAATDLGPVAAVALQGLIRSSRTMPVRSELAAWRAQTPA